MNRSSKFNFFLPQNTDPIEVSDFNSNFETIDANLLTKAQSLTDAQKAAVRANAGLNVANNLTTTEAGSVLDARQGKALNEKTSTAIALIAGSSRSEILSNIDALVSGAGQAFFYMSSSIAELVGLERQTHFCTLACQNANVRVISAVRGGRADAITLQRTSSGWASSWITYGASGTWTPNLQRATASTALGKYQRIGNLYICSFYFDITAVESSAPYINGSSLPGYTSSVIWAIGGSWSSTANEFGTVGNTSNNNVWFAKNGQMYGLSGCVGKAIRGTLTYIV